MISHLEEYIEDFLKFYSPTEKFKILVLGAGTDINFSPTSSVKIDFVDRCERTIQPGSNLYGDMNFYHTDIFDFLSSITERYDLIWADRVFEHIDFKGDKDLFYLIHLCQYVLNKNGELVFSVPDFNKVAETVKDISTYSPFWFIETLKCTMEILSDSNDPHRSIWTKDIARAIVEGEGYFKIKEFVEDVVMDGKRWYMRVISEKIV